jgi:hypothetical protein
MSFRGDIPANTMAEVKLSADFSNSGNAILMAGSGPFGSDPTGKSTVVAPGGSDTLKIQTPNEGIVKVVVDFSDDDDSGVLEVKTSGGFKDGDPIAGDTSWTYSV